MSFHSIAHNWSRRKFSTAIFAAVTASLLLSATVAHAVTPQEVKKKGKVVVGIQGDNPPWGFVDAKGEQQGFDADIGKLLAKDLGVPVEFVPLAVANRIPALVSGKVDVVIAVMGMYPDRAKSVQFSKPYSANDVIIAAPRNTVIKSVGDMARLVIGVPRSSAQDSEVTRRAPAGTVIRRFDDDAATIQAMLSGQVQAVGGNGFYPNKLNAAQPDTYERKLDLTRQWNGIATRLGEKEWNAYINTFIDKLRTNGQIGSAYMKWMGFAPPAEYPSSLEGIPFTAH